MFASHVLRLLTIYFVSKCRTRSRSRLEYSSRPTQFAIQYSMLLLLQLVQIKRQAVRTPLGINNVCNTFTILNSLYCVSKSVSLACLLSHCQSLLRNIASCKNIISRSKVLYINYIINPLSQVNYYLKQFMEHYK